MIRVNLLAQSPGTAPPKVWVPREQRTAVIGLGMLFATATGIGGWWWYLNHARENAEVSIARSEARLEDLKDELQVLEAARVRKSDLEQRLALIDRLREAKRGPVTLLETVSSSVPEGLWLLEIKQMTSAIQIDGRATSLTSVTDFAEMLQQSGKFKMPVEILTTLNETVEDTTVVRFSMRAEPAAPAPVVSTTAASTTASAAVSAPAPAGRPGV